MTFITTFDLGYNLRFLLNIFPNRVRWTASDEKHWRRRTSHRSWRLSGTFFWQSDNSVQSVWISSPTVRPGRRQTDSSQHKWTPVAQRWRQSCCHGKEFWLSDWSPRTKEICQLSWQGQDCSVLSRIKHDPWSNCGRFIPTVALRDPYVCQKL